MNSKLEQKWIDSWIKLANYLSDERLDEKTIFTLRFQDGCNFIIHPEGKDGNTLDLTLCFNISLVDESLLNEKKTIDKKFKKICEDNKSSVLYPITIDGNPFIVKQIITMTQLKRIVGADNPYYKMECINKPEHWKGQDPYDDEPVDLGSIVPYYYTLEFNCVNRPLPNK